MTRCFFRVASLLVLPILVSHCAEDDSDLHSAVVGGLNAWRDDALPEPLRTRLHRSVDVVQARVVSAVTEPCLDDPIVICTFADLLVTRSLKGTDGTVRLVAGGGMLDNGNRLSISDSPVIEEGDEAIVFLAAAPPDYGDRAEYVTEDGDVGYLVVAEGNTHNGAELEVEALWTLFEAEVIR